MLYCVTAYLGILILKMKQDGYMYCFVWSPLQPSMRTRNSSVPLVLGHNLSPEHAPNVLWGFGYGVSNSMFGRSAFSLFEETDMNLRRDRLKESMT
jgi:hypothetical protein